MLPTDVLLTDFYIIALCPITHIAPFWVIIRQSSPASHYILVPVCVIWATHCIFYKLIMSNPMALKI